jgi:hypothetical protein
MDRSLRSLDGEAWVVNRELWIVIRAAVGTAGWELSPPTPPAPSITWGRRASSFQPLRQDERLVPSQSTAPAPKSLP